MSEEEIELIDCLRVVWKRHWLVIGGITVFMLAALVYSLSLPVIYEGSVVLEVGRVYSLSLGGWQEKLDLIEDPKNIETLLKSNDVLNQLKEKVGRGLDARVLKQAIKIDVRSNPLIEINLKLQDPSAIIEGLTFLTQWVIIEHKKKYDLAIQALNNNISSIRAEINSPAHNRRKNIQLKVQIEEKIKNIKEQLLSESELTKTDRAYREALEQQILSVLTEVEKSKKKISVLNSEMASNIEILIVESILQNYELQLPKLQQELHRLNQSEAERQKQKEALNSLITDLEMQNVEYQNDVQNLRLTISMLNNLKGASENTKLRTAPIVHEKPISSGAVRNVIIAGILGLMLTIILAFFLEYQEKENVKH